MKIETKTNFWLNLTAEVDLGHNATEEIPIKIRMEDFVDVLFQNQSCESREFMKQRLIELGLAALETERSL
jgi:hypothetical protein